MNWKKKHVLPMASQKPIPVDELRTILKFVKDDPALDYEPGEAPVSNAIEKIEAALEEENQCHVKSFGVMEEVRIPEVADGRVLIDLHDDAGPRVVVYDQEEQREQPIGHGDPEHILPLK